MYIWEEKYEIIDRISWGSQGDCFILSEKSSGLKFFLKQLKNNTSERRWRFFRETVIFQSLNIEWIPKIIETNTDSLANTDVPLFYIAEYIEGNQLDKIVQSKNLSEVEIISLFHQLLTILQKCHSSDVVHRDIKPENIIIQNDWKLFLVDFGIAHAIDEVDETQIGQEIGNRFLKLPEFTAWSASKRDIRSDITLASAIALYMITGVYPRKLCDESGHYPHQTSLAAEKIVNLKSSIIWNIIFDKAFPENLARRWNSINDIIDLLSKITSSETDNESLENESYLNLHAQSISFDKHAEIRKSLQWTGTVVRENILTIIKTKAKWFRSEWMGWVYNLGDLEDKYQIRIYPIGKDKFVTVNIKTYILWEQVIWIVQINEKSTEIFRIQMGDGITTQQIEYMNKLIQEKLFPELVNLIKNG